jgi:hypothetical protein
MPGKLALPHGDLIATVPAVAGTSEGSRPFGGLGH